MVRQGLLKINLSRRAALGILACALTALVYRSALDLPFVFDDRTTVLLNPDLVRPWDLPADLTTLSYAIDRALWGFSSFGFHLTNVILHIVVVALFYGTCTRALADAPGQTGVRPGSDPGRKNRGQTGSNRGLTPVRPGSTVDSGAGLWVAFFAAAVFGLHPLMSATALYVSARSEMLGAAAFMIALMFARRAILASRTGPGLLAAGFGAVAVAASPAAAGLPIVLLAYDAWVLRTGGWRRRLWRAYVPAMAAVILAIGWRLHASEPPPWACSGTC